MASLRLAVFGCIANFWKRPTTLVMTFIVLLFLFTFVTFILLTIAVKENDIGLDGLILRKEVDSFSLIRSVSHGKDMIVQ